MPNLMRNDLTIEGASVKHVLDAIGFNPNGKDSTGVPVFGARSQQENPALLIDFNRIVPPPNDPPEGGWTKWASDNWGTVPYDGAMDGDIFELTENKASFKFFTKWTSAFPIVERLAKRFPQCRFHLWNWEQTNHLWGEASWENGQRSLFVPLSSMKLQDDDDVPANDPITEEMMAIAEASVKAALDIYKGCTSPNVESAVATVAEIIAVRGHSVEVEFEPNEDGSCYLCVDVERAVCPDER